MTLTWAILASALSIAVGSIIGWKIACWILKEEVSVLLPLIAYRLWRENRKKRQ